jgi:hypothetical protein
VFKNVQSCQFENPTIKPEIRKFVERKNRKFPEKTENLAALKIFEKLFCDNKRNFFAVIEFTFLSQESYSGNIFRASRLPVFSN